MVADMRVFDEKKDRAGDPAALGKAIALEMNAMCRDLRASLSGVVSAETLDHGDRKAPSMK